MSAALTFLSPTAFTQGTDCLPRPLLAAFSEGNNQLRLDIVGEPGINYALEVSADGQRWSRLATNRSALGVVSFQRARQPGPAHQFFRALSVTSADGLGANFIFDGESFAGWDGVAFGTFRIADCSIVSGSPVQKPAQNIFLCTTRQYTNFILRLEFKLVSASGPVNSGVQIRSARIAGGPTVRGYQADLGDEWWGCLWDEARRGVVLAAANQTEVLKVLKPNQWNSYVIQAEGPRLRFWINGYQTIDYTESDSSIPQYGIIGLQTYSGMATEACFRHITVEVLP